MAVSNHSGLWLLFLLIEEQGIDDTPMMTMISWASPSKVVASAMTQASGENGVG